MTKELLERYPAICRELRIIERHNLFNGRRDELERQKREIEEFVSRIDEPDERSVVMLRGMFGLNWQQVAGRMEGVYSMSYLRKIYREALKKYS